MSTFTDPATAASRGIERRGPHGLEIVSPREVPLGGLRAMTVRRTLPQRGRSLIGAWCFADHYGPDDVAVTGGMVVPPHPHTGLQTVSWLFTGEVEHRDSLGTHAMVRAGELNLMTAGRGIAHSEVSTPATTVLHGVQLWTALPAHARGTPPAFDHYVPPAVELPGGVLRVFLGTLAGSTSPIATVTPLLGAELVLDGGLTLPVDPSFEHGILVDAGPVEVDGVRVEPGELAYLPPGTERLTLRSLRAAGGADDARAPGADHERATAIDGRGDPDGPARMLLLGGPPFGEPIVMWWNFLGGSHDDITAARADWQSELASQTADPLAEVELLTRGRTYEHPTSHQKFDLGAEGAAGGLAGGLAEGRRFGVVRGYPGAALPAPGLPGTRLLPRV